MKNLHFWVLRALLGIFLVFFSASSLVAEEGAVRPDGEPQLAEAPVDPPVKEKTFLAKINDQLFSVLFFDVAFGAIEVARTDRSGRELRTPTGKPIMDVVPLPFLVCVLAFGGLFFTLYYRFMNIRAFKHAIDVIRGRFDKEEDEGEISHFRALTSALSATVGLGNIAGVAIAIQTGGPGAVFWMVVMAVFGMSAKFSSCTLSQMYRKVNADGSISGGPMYYLDLGLRERGKAWGAFGKVLAIAFAFMVMGGSIGGGNMFQANQTVEAFVSTFDLGEGWKLYIGLILAVMVGLVILGGIKRIGLATSRIVPLMCGVYVLACLIVIISNIDRVPETLELIVRMAFTENAFFGGLVGVLVTGVRRAAFSNEAGLGSAAIAHAAARTDEPVREGIVAMMEPFIDTIIVCVMTALVVVITGVWEHPEMAAQGGNLGVSLTSAAFETVIPWFPIVLTISVGLFAYSTLISWCYYGERGWIYLLNHVSPDFGLQSVKVFRIIFVCFVIVGAVNSLEDVISFTDAMILSMAIPNIVGSIALAPLVLPKVLDYWGRYTSGAMQPVK